MSKKPVFFASLGSPAAKEEPEEKDLIRAAQLGDETAFRSLYDSHRNSIYSLLYYLVKDSQTAEDLLQTVFLKIFRGLPNYRFEAGFRTWACKIAWNEARNHKKRNQKLLPLAVIWGTALETDLALGPQDNQQLQQREALVRRAVMELKPLSRAVIVLKYVDGLSYEDMAMVLGCSSGTVASRLNRALQKLEVLLSPLRNLI